jgi:hypothetical protein
LLAEFREQLLQLVNGLVRVDAVCFKRGGGAAVEIGPQNVDETRSRISFAFFNDPYFRSKLIRALYKLSGWSRMQTEFIADPHLALD